MILEEDNIQPDEQTEGVLFEADYEDDLDLEEEEAVFEQRLGALVSKDNTTWLSNLPNQAIRMGAHNVFRGTAVGPSRATKGLIESAVFDLIFTPSMLEQVLIDTNAKAEKTFQKWNEENRTAKERVWNKVTNIELRAFIGLLFLPGVNKSNDEDTDVLWSTEAVC